MFRFALAACASLTVLAGAGGDADGRADPVPARVLFVGNSLTSTNDLPGTVASLAAASGRTLHVREVAHDGYSLEDHWRRSAARAELASGEWDAVVLQQGPSSLPAGRAHLRVWAKRFASLARAAGAQPALLTVWPESTRRAALPAVIASYRNAARAARAHLLPAGAAWRAAWTCWRALALYGPDGFHPSTLGTDLAALVVYGGLLDASARTPALRPQDVPPRTARLLQAAAATALGRRVPPARRCGA